VSDGSVPVGVRGPLDGYLPRASALPPLVGEVFRQTMGADSVHTALDTALGILDRTMSPTWCAIWLFDAATDTWFISHSRRLSGEAAELRFARGAAIPCLVGERGVARRLDALDDEGAFHRSHEVHYRMRSALYVPMSMRGRPVGVIALYSDMLAHFTEEDESQLGLVAAHLSQLVTALSLLDERGRVCQLDARERVARDLHDGMLQNLSSLQLYVYGCIEAARDGDMAEVSALVDLLSTTVAEAISEVRSAIAALRSVALLRSLEPMLQRMRGRLEAAGLTVEVPAERLDLNPTISDVLASVAREASNNVLKHSDATLVRFTLAKDDRDLVFECCDNGVGHQPAEGEEAKGLGLRLLAEGVVSVGGTLSHSSPPGGGFVLRCCVPLETT
jgi:signal transduction histidine kinase